MLLRKGDELELKDGCDDIDIIDLFNRYDVRVIDSFQGKILVQTQSKKNPEYIETELIWSGYVQKVEKNV